MKIVGLGKVGSRKKIPAISGTIIELFLSKYNKKIQSGSLSLDVVACNKYFRTFYKLK